MEDKNAQGATYLKSLLNQYPEGVRFEYFLAQLVMNGLLELDDFVVSSRGLGGRLFKNAVQEIGEDFTGELTIGITEESLYDRLPKPLFHSSYFLENKADLSVAEKIFGQEASLVRAKLDQLEKCIHRQRILAALKESQLLMAGAALPPSVYDLPEGLAPRTRVVLANLLPVLPRIIGRPSLTEAALGLLLGVKATIFIPKTKTPVTDKRKGGRIGESRLGQGAGVDCLIYPGANKVIVQLGSIQADDLPGYLADKPNMKEIEIIYGYLFPAEWEIETKIKFNEFPKARISSPQHQFFINYGQINDPQKNYKSKQAIP